MILKDAYIFADTNTLGAINEAIEQVIGVPYYPRCSEYGFIHVNTGYERVIEQVLANFSGYTIKKIVQNENGEVEFVEYDNTRRNPDGAR